MKGRLAWGFDAMKGRRGMLVYYIGDLVHLARYLSIPMILNIDAINLIL